MIPATWRANFAYLLKHPWQLALAVLGIAIGVAVIVAVDLANASARKAFFLSMDAVTGAATHQIVGGPLGIEESAYVQLRVEHGIRNIAPVVAGSVVVSGSSMQVLGIDLFAEQSMRNFTSQSLIGSGAGGVSTESLFRQLLTQPGAAIMSKTGAASHGLGVGDRFEIVAGGHKQIAVLLAVYASNDTFGLDNFITTDIATAQSWLDQVGWLSRIDVRIDYDDAVTLERLDAALPSGARLLTSAGRSRTTADLSAAFMTNLSAMSFLALLIGLFLIYNSVSFSVLQRREMIGVQRALGVTRGQVLALLLGESAIIGAVAACAGVLLGAWLGEYLLMLVSQSINDFYYRVNATDVSISGATIAKGWLAGVCAAVLAATVPAIEATSYQPTLAMTRSTLERRARRLVPVVAAVGIAAVIVGAIVLSLSERSLTAGLAAVFLLIFGFAFCVPLLVRGITKVLAPLAASLGGTPARMAISGIASSLSRTGVAIVALSIAVSATIGVSVMVDSFRESVSDWLEQTLQADLYVGAQRGSLDPALIETIIAVPGIEAFSTSRRAWLEDETGRTQLIAIQMAPGGYSGTEILDADPAEVWPAWERGDVVLVSEPYAYQHGVEKGDKVSLRTNAGNRNFRVAATYQSYDINASSLLLSRTTYDKHWNDDRIDSVGLYLADAATSADVISVMTDIETSSAGLQQIRVASNVSIRERSLRIFDRTFIITDVLYWLAICVAVIGILGAMLALQLERARELALLRALGMTPSQLGGMITMQTGAIGLLSGLAAVPLGLVMAYVLTEVINRRAFGWQIDMLVSPRILVSAIIFAVVAALIGGVYPAWRASQSQPALAMREE